MSTSTPSPATSRPWRHCLLGAILASLVFPFLPATAAPSVPDPLVFRHENVLGTSLELRIRAAAPSDARAAERQVLAEIDRLAKIFSTYDAGSEFSRWQTTRDQPLPVSAELLAVLQLADFWRTASAGTFQPAIVALSQVWKDAAKTGALPTDASLAPARQLAAAPAWSLDPAARTATRLGQAPLTLDAIAKGWIVERAGGLAAQNLPGLKSLLLNIGGDLRHWGKFEEYVDVADPRADAENAPPFTTIRILNAALATSGGYRRYVRIGQRTYSHIIDPRTGHPPTNVLAASVVAPDGATADALATLLNLVGPTEIPSLSNQLARADWLVVRADGSTLRSRGWTRREGPPLVASHTAPPPPKPRPATPPSATAPASTDWPANYELRVDFELNRPEGGRYARPYIALWIEDADGFPVRTLVLWLLQGDKGLRWLPDLRRWHRSDQMRALVDPRNLVNAVSSATRPPGKYGTVWDGTDDQGQRVKPGRYTLYLEVSREHGTYQLLRHDFDVAAKPFQAALSGNVEIKGASLAFGPKPTAATARPSPAPQAAGPTR